MQVPAKMFRKIGQFDISMDGDLILVWTSPEFNLDSLSHLGQFEPIRSVASQEHALRGVSKGVVVAVKELAKLDTRVPARVILAQCDERKSLRDKAVPVLLILHEVVDRVVVSEGFRHISYKPNCPGAIAKRRDEPSLDGLELS